MPVSSFYVNDSLEGGGGPLLSSKENVEGLNLRPPSVLLD
jgi:hypothetical protein